MNNEKKTVKIAIMGAGTVGGGVYKVLNMRKDDMLLRAGTEIEIEKILVKSISETRKDVDASLLTESFEDIVNDESIQTELEEYFLSDFWKNTHLSELYTNSNN